MRSHESNLVFARPCCSCNSEGILCSELMVAQHFFRSSTPALKRAEFSREHQWRVFSSSPLRALAAPSEYDCQQGMRHCLQCTKTVHHYDTLLPVDLLLYG